MSIEIRAGEDREAGEWDEHVERSTGGTPFHYYSVLETIADYADATLHTPIAYKGQEPVGVYPLFERSKGPVSVVFSPPPNLNIPYLGPLLLNTEGLKRRRQDVRNHRLVEAYEEWIENEISPRFTNIRTSVGYGDVRPFAWSGYRTVPRFTYEIDLRVDSDELLERFSSGARSNVQSEYDVEYTIEQGNPDDIDRIVTQVRERHEDQGESFPLPSALVQDLYERLDAGAVRPYVCRIDGSFVGGIVCIENEHTIYGWFGGAKTDTDLPANDLLDWYICQDAIERGLERYDLVGANHERIYPYKAKFSPTLRTYYSLRRGTVEMNLISKLYTQLKD